MSGRADLTYRIAYASDGATAWRDDPEFVMVAAADPTLRVRMVLTARDEARGFSTRDAYFRALGERLAERVAAEVAEALIEPDDESGGTG